MPASSGIVIAVILKAIGAIFGTLMSFAFVPVFTFRAIAIRAGVSFPSGFIFADAVRGWAQLPASQFNEVVGGTLAGLFSWVVFGAAIRLFQSATWANVPWPWLSKKK